MTSHPATAETDAGLVSASRARFPALRRRHHGHAVAYFDSPGGTQVPQEVIDAMTDYLSDHNANTHWAYPSSEETDRAIAEARAALADLFNASPDEVAFGANMTTLTFHVARSLGRQWSSDDVVVVTELDHQANVAPWRALERERGIKIRVVKMLPESGTLDWTDLERALDCRPRLLAIGAASNAIGTINDVSRACRLAREAGALSYVDAVHFAPHALVDVRAMGADFLACSAYKFYGPHIGVLWGRKERLETLDVPKLDPAPDYAPDRVETGTQNHEGIVGAAAAVEFLASLGSGTTRRQRLVSAFTTLHRRGQRLVERLWQGLGTIRGLQRYGPDPSLPRTPTVSFASSALPSIAITRALADRGLFASHGDFYATSVVERLGHGEDGLVRIGCACYTTEEEIERLLEALRGLAD